MIDYIRDGQAIYRQSFATIRAEANLAGIPADLEKLAVRVIHACGMVDVVDDLRRPAPAAAAPRHAGAAILCDARMVAEGVTRSRLPAANRVICTLNEADVRRSPRNSAIPARRWPWSTGASTRRAAWW